MTINDVISGFAKVVVERCGFHHWIAQRISWGDVVSVFLYLLQFLSYDVINDVIMTDADCSPGREPRSVAASSLFCHKLTSPATSQPEFGIPGQCTATPRDAQSTCHHHCKQIKFHSTTSLRRTSQQQTMTHFVKWRLVGHEE